MVDGGTFEAQALYVSFPLKRLFLGVALRFNFSLCILFRSCPSLCFVGLFLLTAASIFSLLCSLSISSGPSPDCFVSTFFYFVPMYAMYVLLSNSHL